QTVVLTPDRVVVIEPAIPDVVYVPVYEPLYVYSGWARPWWFYPTFFTPIPFAQSRFFFTFGVPWGFGLWGRCNWDRSAPSVVVDVSVHNQFVARTSSVPQQQAIATSSPRTAWTHDPSHRRGAN